MHIMPRSRRIYRSNRMESMLLIILVLFGSHQVHALQTIRAPPSSGTTRSLLGKWLTGVTADRSSEYWFDQRIHCLGNVGLSGALHAAVTPACTKLIDVMEYNNEDIRRTVRPFRFSFGLVSTMNYRFQRVFAAKRLQIPRKFLISAVVLVALPGP